MCVCVWGGGGEGGMGGLERGVVAMLEVSYDIFDVQKKKRK